MFCCRKPASRLYWFQALCGPVAIRMEIAMLKSLIPTVFLLLSGKKESSQ